MVRELGGVRLNDDGVLSVREGVVAGEEDVVAGTREGGALSSLFSEETEATMVVSGVRVRVSVSEQGSEKRKRE